MAVMARWRDKSWEVSTNKITAIENLSFAYEQKADNNRSTEGSPSTNERGRELFSLSFSCVLHSGAGVDVMREIESWEKLVTMTGLFYLNGKQLGPKLQLRKVSVGSTTLDDFGRIRLATLSFALNEHKEAAAPVPESTSALNVGAQTADKTAKKPENSQATAAPTITIQVGSYVKMTGNTYTNGITVPQAYKERSFQVTQVKGEKTLLLGPNRTSLWVYTNELTLVSGRAVDQRAGMSMIM